MSASLGLRSLRTASLAPSRGFTITRCRAFHASSRRSEQYPDADIKTFNKVVNVPNRLVMVDFYADWCGPCRLLSPILAKLATEPELRTKSGLPVDVVKIDTEKQEQAALAQRHEIRALPTVVAFQDGKVVARFTGALNEDGVRRFLQGL